MKRCAWAGNDPLMTEYHDKEWGVPVHRDVKLFEFLTLEGAQAGLNWMIILKKRANYRKAFESFNPAKIARYSGKDVKRLLADPGIVRNRLKITATIMNARQFLEIQKEFGSFDSYIWQFTGGQSVKHKFKSLSAIPAKKQRIRRNEQGPRKAGFQVRRLHDMLRFHASRRNRKRSHNRLFQVQSSLRNGSAVIQSKFALFTVTV
jgi:DNA-3-methyladenine glycosylase I